MALRISYFKLFRALFARSLFAFHALVAIWRVSFVYKDLSFWLLAVFIVAIFLEGAANILTRDGDETRWLCPSIFLYLSGTVPALWFLELHLSHDSHKQPVNGSTGGETIVMEFVDGMQVKFDSPITPQMWVQILQQTLLVVLILGRWILPKGQITREQLSHILLVYLAIAADIVELFEIFKERKVRYNRQLTVTILIIWSVSLLQYPLVLTQGNRKGVRLGWYDQNHGGTALADDVAASNKRPKKPPRQSWVTFKKIVKNMNIWGILVSIALQDGPFLSIRLYLLIYHRVISYSMIFFACKNTLICLLQSYRLVAICYETVKNAYFSPRFMAQRMPGVYTDTELMRQNHEAAKLKDGTSADSFESGPLMAINHENAKVEKSRDTTCTFVLENFDAIEDEGSDSEVRRVMRTTHHLFPFAEPEDVDTPRFEEMGLTIVDPILVHFGKKLENKGRRKH